MTEEEARGWIAHEFGAAGVGLMERFVALVLAESEQQNLVARSTINAIWSRHVVDSAQLIPLAGGTCGSWLDVGSGAGFPGIVVSALTERPVILAEPRKRRVMFLEQVIEALDLGARVLIHPGKVESLHVAADVISARAVAPLIDLFAGAEACSSKETRWLLPKGQSARDEVAIAQRAWHGAFHVEQSLTNSGSLIVVARGVARRCKS
jgi:16S rRNA (guanine527-N7)-methyltransferase